MTAEMLLERGHEVVIVETDRTRIDAVYDDLDCSFLHGDGSRPGILQELGPSQTDVLFCLTDNDQVNILASVVARSLGFRRVVTAIGDSELEGICGELKLAHVIEPARTISRYLADVVEGVDVLELTTFIRGDARFFSFTVGERERGQHLTTLDLPDEARVVCIYRHDELILADGDTRLVEGDEVVVLTRSRHLSELEESFRPRTSDDDLE
jgi:trk system potassium uptake protein TrkA